MTDAYVSRNVSDATETTTANQDGTPSKNITNTETCLPDGLTLNLACNCSETNKVETQILSNVSSNSNKKDNFTDSVENPQNNQFTNVGSTDPNTVLKYVYKKNEKNDVVPTKTIGHPKNTLRRKKRSQNLQNVDGTKAPLIVNYETSHAPYKDVEVWLPARNTANVIKHSALADFNIETLHDNEPLKKTIHGPSTETIPEDANGSNESVDRENYRNNDAKSQGNSEESDEQIKESAENSGENEQYSRSNKEYSDSRENYKVKNTNDEINQHASIELEKVDDSHSKEDSDSKEHNKSKYESSNRVNESGESAENSSEESEKRKNSYPSNDEGPNSEEQLSSKYKSQEIYQHTPDYGKTTLPDIIQDVDLGEYERIQINKNGEIETAKDTHENTSFDPDKDVILTTKPNNGIKQNEKISTLSNGNTEPSSLESHDHDEPTHINDGEVKPVVEINSEVESSESSDENSNSNEALEEKLENESLETLTGLKENDSIEKSDKLQEDSKAHNQGDVKQQFERIPLNYNHADNKKSKDSNVQAKEQRQNNEDDEGTVDKLKPRYDDNLNIKFDNINIKLPEIKLPDDILSYAHENPPVYNDEQREKPSYYLDTTNYNKNKDNQRKIPTYYQDSSVYNKNTEAREKPTHYKDSSKYNKNNDEQVEKPAYYQNNKDEQLTPRFYHYSDEVQDEPRARVKQEENDDESYNDKKYYYADEKEKEDYRQKQNKDEEDDDDLYEKFVRERFGKRGTFEKRLEKLTDYKAQNPHLYQKVQKILKKTKDVKAEAEKSGDPNAGYSWTLEYGEKL